MTAVGRGDHKQMPSWPSWPSFDCEPELAMHDSWSFQKRNGNLALVLELITKSGITLLQFIAVYLPCNPS